MALSLGNSNPSSNGMGGNIYDSTKESPCLTDNKGDGYKIAVPLGGVEIISQKYKGLDGESRFYENEVPTLAARDYKEPMMVTQPIGCIDNQGRLSKEVDLNDTAPTLRAENHGNVPMVVEDFYSNRDSRVYEGESPTLRSDRQGLKVAIPVITPDREKKRQNGRRFKENGDPSFTLTAQDRHGVAVGVEPLGVLRSTRSEYGKEIRKDYEAGKLDISRHEFLDKEIREDGVSNTIDSVQKDNLLAEALKAEVEGFNTMPDGTCRTLKSQYQKNSGDDFATEKGDRAATCVAVKVQIAEGEENKEHPGLYVELETGVMVYAVWYEKYQCYITVRRLTPKECFRLQGWTDEYFERAEFVNSDSQLYKQAGNGVTVTVVYEIAKRLSRGEKE